MPNEPRAVRALRRTVLVVSFLESFGTILLERAIYFFSKERLGYSELENLASGGSSYRAGMLAAALPLMLACWFGSLRSLTRLASANARAGTSGARTGVARLCADGASARAAAVPGLFRLVRCASNG